MLATARPPDSPASPISPVGLGKTASLVSSGSELWSLTGTENGKNLRILELDVADESSVARFVVAVRGMGFATGLVGLRLKVDVCVVVAGVLAYPCRIVDM